MKKVFLVLFFMAFTMVGCSGEETEQRTTEKDYDNYVSVIIGDETYSIGFNGYDDSLFELIDASEIEMEYLSTEYGPMITGIDDLQQDEFHWIDFTKNDEFADAGLDNIEYQDGDVFEFNENMTTWDQTFTTELKTIIGNDLVYEIGEYNVLVEQSSVDDEKIIVGGEYTFTGQPSIVNGSEVNLTVSEFSADFEYITIMIGEDAYDLMYDSETNDSVFDLILNSSIDFEYESTNFGKMITLIDDLQQDDFHWIGFTVNDEFANAGLDTLDYQSGDVFKFTEEIATWEMTLKAEIIEINQAEIVFQNENQTFIVEVANLPETIVVNDLVVGFIYDLTGVVDTEASTEVIAFNPSSLALDVVTDFTKLYDLEIGDVFILKFTVTFIEDSSEFGIEIYAEDINGLSSTEISNNMRYPSTTNYIFYTIPDGYTLVENNTYMGRFIYQINEPSQIPQITLYEQNINGETIDNIIVE